MIVDDMYRYIFRTLVPAGLLAAACGTAVAQPDLVAKTTVIHSPVKLLGKVSVRELALKAAMAPARPKARAAREMPKHRRPDGSLTSAPRASIHKPPPPPPPSVQPNASVSPASVTGVVGINSQDNVTANGFELEPPDQGLAVHNNVAAEINNVVLQFFNASTGAPLLPAPVDLSSFFGSSLYCIFFCTLTDPQAFFDPTTGRWFFTILETDTTFFSVQNLDIAVSTSGDPLGSYNIYQVEAFSSDLAGCGGLDCLPDFPHAGYDANGLYISVNLFNVFNTSGSAVEAATYAFPKAQLEAGAASFTYVRIDYPNDFVVQPSVPAPGEPYETAANGTEYLLEARNIVDRSHNVRVWAISNTNNIVTNPSSLQMSSVDVTAESYGPTVAATQPNVVGPYCKSKGFKSAPLLDGGYQSFTATVQKANGKLYGALPFNAPDSNGLARDAIAWFVLTPSVNSGGVPSAVIANQGYLIPPAGYSLLYPAFAVRSGLSVTGVLGFSITNKSQTVTGGFPSAAFLAFTGTPLTTGNIIRVSGPGVTSDDGFTGCDPTNRGSRVGRWGDYGAATVDSVTGGHIYTANENISGPQGPAQATNWGTFITQLP